MNKGTDRHPVLLIPGIFKTSKVFHNLSAYLTKQGWAVHSLDFSINNGTLELEDLAKEIAIYIEKNFAPEENLDLVGYSMGGLVCRYYVQQLGGIGRVKRLVTISAPHYGTWTAYLLNRSGCVQMRPGSTFLKDLNQDVAILGKIKFTSIWTTLFDAIIVPNTSSQIPVGKQVTMLIWGHKCMIKNPKIFELVAEGIS